MRRLEPRVALVVEPDIAVARLRHEGEAALLFLREEIELVLAGAAPVELELGLVADPLEGRRPHAADTCLGRGLGEELERRDPLPLQPLHLHARNPRDEREVVVLVPARLAEGEEVAETAEIDRIGVGCATLFDGFEEAPPQAPVVGGEVPGPKGLALAEPVDDVHRLGRVALDACDLLGVVGELKDVLRLRAARELRVDDLVEAVRLELDEVGNPTPAVVLEAGLVDDVGCPRRGSRPRSRQRSRARRCSCPRRASPSRYRSSCSSPLRLDDLGVEVLAERLLELAARDGQLEHRQVWAGQEGVEVRGGEYETVSALAHPLTLARNPESGIVKLPLCGAARSCSTVVATPHSEGSVR